MRVQFCNWQEEQHKWGAVGVLGTLIVRFIILIAQNGTTGASRLIRKKLLFFQNSFKCPFFGLSEQISIAETGEMS